MRLKKLRVALMGREVNVRRDDPHCARRLPVSGGIAPVQFARATTRTDVDFDFKNTVRDIARELFFTESRAPGEALFANIT